MKSKAFYTWISAFFLLLLLGVKGMGYHSLSHNEGDEAIQCELCSFVVHQESHQFNPPAPCEIPLQRMDIIEDQETLSVIPAYPDRLTPDSLFSRPPPVWV